MSIKELREYEVAAKEFEDRLRVAREELHSLKEQHYKLSQKRMDMVDQDTKGTKQYSYSDFKKVDTELAELEKGIEFTSERVTRIEQSKNEQLAPLVRKAREGAEARARELKGVIDGVLEEMRRNRANMLLQLKKAHTEVNAELTALDNELERAELRTGNRNSYRSLSFDIREVLHDGEGNIGILPTYAEFDSAFYRGEVPDWAYKYEGERDGVPEA